MIICGHSLLDGASVVIWLGQVWPNPIGKEVTSLQSLCCLHVGPLPGHDLGSFFFEPYLLLAWLHMSIFLPNNTVPINYTQCQFRIKKLATNRKSITHVGLMMMNSLIITFLHLK